MHAEFGDIAGSIDQPIVHLDVDAHFGDWSDIRRIKSIEGGGTDFDRSIAAEESRIEENAYFWNDIITSHNQSAEEVVFAIGSSLENWNLTAGYDDGLAEVLEHEGKGGGGVGEGVCAVENNKAVEELVRLLEGRNKFICLHF